MTISSLWKSVGLGSTALILVASFGAKANAQSSFVVYSSIAGTPNYSAFGASTGLLGYDDYTTTYAATQANFTLASFQFVGGGTAANTPFEFTWTNTAGTTSESLFATLSGAGNFIYTFTAPVGFTIPSAGEFFITDTSSTLTGQFFLTSAPPSIGSNSTSVGKGPDTGNPTLYQAFAFSAAAPDASALALAVAGMVPMGVVAIRRRRSGK